MEKSIALMIQKTAAETPDKIAVIANDEKCTYNLNGRSGPCSCLMWK